MLSPSSADSGTVSMLSLLAIAALAFFIGYHLIMGIGGADARAAGRRAIDHDLALAVVADRRPLPPVRGLEHGELEGLGVV